jgi:hypothetical protein
MQSIPFVNRSTSWTRRQAWFLLVATGVAIGWGVLAAVAPVAPAEATTADGGDLRLYRRIIERVHAGENYYEAAGSELRAAGYATGSLFNWRSPVYAWLIGTFPSATWGQILLVMGVLATLLMAYAVLQREGGTLRAALGTLLLLGAFQWCVDGDAFLSQELWAGMLITLSVCAYANGYWRPGVAAGLGALFFRELSLPYCLIALLVAGRQKRHHEVVIWLVGFAVYTLFLTLHGMEVARRLTPDDRVPASWIQFGGPAFILATCRMNAFLFPFPLWVSAIYLPLALLGLAHWRGEMGMRLGLTAGAYVAAFGVLGQPFNDYWGLLYVPLLPFGFVWVPATLQDLFARILQPVLRDQGEANQEQKQKARY